MHQRARAGVTVATLGTAQRPGPSNPVNSTAGPATRLASFHRRKVQYGVVPAVLPVPLQVLALDVILANGTRRVFTNETDPFLMKVCTCGCGCGCGCRGVGLEPPCCAALPPLASVCGPLLDCTVQASYCAKKRKTGVGRAITADDAVAAGSARLCWQVGHPGSRQAAGCAGGASAQVRSACCASCVSFRAPVAAELIAW